MGARIGKAWFVPKRYGYGATPVTWQGWVVLVVFVGLLILDIRLVRGGARWVCAAGLAVGFVGLVWSKTAGAWRWRWGGAGGWVRGWRAASDSDDHYVYAIAL